MSRDVAAEIRAGLFHLLEQDRLPVQTELEVVVHFAEAAETNLELAEGDWDNGEGKVYADLAAAYALLAKLGALALGEGVEEKPSA